MSDTQEGNGRSIGDRMMEKRGQELRSRIEKDNYGECVLESRQDLDLYVVDTLSLLVEQQGKKRSYHIPGNPKEFFYAMAIRSPWAAVAALALYLWFSYGGTVIVKPSANGVGSGHVSNGAVNPQVGKQP